MGLIYLFFITRYNVLWAQHFARRCVCNHTVRECWNLSLTRCARYEELLICERHVSVPFALSSPTPNIFKMKFRGIKIRDISNFYVFLPVFDKIFGVKFFISANSLFFCFRST